MHVKARKLALGFATALLAALLTPAAAADDRVPLGGGAGITLNGNPCTLTTIGNDRNGDLVGLTSDICGGPGAQVAAQGAEDRGTVGTVTAANDYFHYVVIKFDSAKVTPVANYDGFAINGIGPDAAPGQPVCKQGSATGKDCKYIRPFLDSRPDRPTARIQASYQPGDNGGPVTSDDLLVGMIYNGFVVVSLDAFSGPEIRVIYINAILADANASGGPGAGFTPVRA